MLQNYKYILLDFRDVYKSTLELFRQNRITQAPYFIRNAIGTSLSTLSEHGDLKTPEEHLIQKYSEYIEILYPDDSEYCLVCREQALSFFVRLLEHRRELRLSEHQYSEEVYDDNTRALRVIMNYFPYTFHSFTDAGDLILHIRRKNDNL